MEPTVRVRFAPSPTGHLHIGGARTAIYNWAFARRHGGSFILRIDDTDAERSTDENTGAILRSLRWLGLDWDEGPEAGGPHGPYFQTQRSEAYAAALEVLKANGHAYPCFCSTEDLERKREAAKVAGGFSGYDRTCRALAADEAARRITAGEPHVWRVAVPDGRDDVVAVDAIRGEVRWPASAMDDFILVRTDGTPTYMFATVVDDSDMGITHIIRGDDHLSNTPRQIIVYEALEVPVPVFAHMSLIFGADGKRLSKRHGATSVEAYRDEGYLPDALLNYLALLGWSIDGETTLFDRDTLVARFDLARVSSAPAVWDPEKLAWMNGAYIRSLSPAAFAEVAGPWISAAGLTADVDTLARIAPLVVERVTRMAELPAVVRPLLVGSAELAFDERGAAWLAEHEWADEVLTAALDATRDVEPFTHDAIEAAYRGLPEPLGRKPKEVFQTIRVAMTGTTVSPPLFESVAILGRDEAVARLEMALARGFAVIDSGGDAR
ncbi:MAG: glutamate--tRNA ligase [Actinobacteria bacterium]|nr:MAG: glutamate--tRNA ligase [Actinomycetota bacterium]